MGNAARQTDLIATGFECAAPDAKQVFLAGTFNDWSDNDTPMKRGKGGNWTADLHLPAGHHEYKFLIDGKWCCRPGCGDSPHVGCSDCVENSFGTMNRVLEVE